MKLKTFIFALVLALAVPAASTAANIISFSKNAKTDYAKRMHSVFVALAKSDYATAWTQQQALEKTMNTNRAAYEDALYPLYDLAQAMFMIRTTKGAITIEQDTWKAEQLVRNVYVRETGIDAANTFLGDDEIELSIDMINNLVEKKLIAETKKENTVEGYQRLLTVLDSNSPAYATAKKQMQALEFEGNCNTVQECREYLRNYPDSPLADKVKAKLVKLEFAEAQKANDEKTWKKFISNYQFEKSATSYISQAKTALKDVQDEAYINSSTTLADLDAYAAANRRSIDNKVFALYDNLINLPTHSYRYMSIKLAFGGVTGRVEETVTDAKGGSFKNYFVFNEQGLLTEAYNGRDKSLTKYVYGFNKQHGFYIKSKQVGSKTYTYTCTYNTSGHLSRVKCTDGTSSDYTYDADGRLTTRTDKTAKGTKTSTYKSGKIRTEKSAKVTLQFLSYDGSRATRINSLNDGKTYVWTYNYTTDTQNRWTKVTAQLDGKPRITVSRKYSN